MAPMPELLTVRDAEVLLGKSERTIRRWLADGTLPSFRVGHSVFLRSEDIRALISYGITSRALATVIARNSTPGEVRSQKNST